MEIAAYHPSGAQNFEVAVPDLEEICTSLVQTISSPNIKVLRFVKYTFEIFMVVIIHHSSSATPRQPLANPNSVATPVLPSPVVLHRSIQPKQ
jgi:hypothetical protein